MAFRCDVTGKKSMAGHSIPHSKHKTKRRFKPNLQSKRVMINGQMVTLKVTAAGMKTLYRA